MHDDLKLLLKINCVNHSCILKCFSDISKWCFDNSLLLNPENCTAMSLQKKATPIIFDFKLQNVVLNRPQFARDLEFSSWTNIVKQCYLLLTGALGLLCKAVKNSETYPPQKFCILALYGLNMNTVLYFETPCITLNLY